MEREVDGPEGDARAPVDVQRDAEPDRRARRPRSRSSTTPSIAPEHLGLRPRRRRDLDRAADRAVARDEAGEDLRPAEVDPDNTFFTHVAATITARMPEQEKPYRVYRGGRAKGRVPLQRPTRTAAQQGSGRRRAGDGARADAHVGRWITLVAAARPPARRRLARRELPLGLAAGSRTRTTACRTVASGAEEPGRAALSTPTTILVLGTDGGTQPGRSDAHRSDSIMLIRTDPGKHRLAFLSIPRDLRVEIPGHGAAKINAAYQIGGPALALRTVKDLTGLDVNHVVFVDFDRFQELIDAVGGIDVDVPRPILSNRFDCPYATAARCQQWERLALREGRPAHERAARARLLADPREPARPGRDGPRPRTAPAAGDPGDGRAR